MSPLPRARVLPLLAVFGCLLTIPATAAAAACPDADARPSQVSEKRIARATVCLLNKERAKHGLSPLRRNSRLTKAARAHTRDMVRKRYFSHTSSSGSDVVSRISRTGYMRGARRWSVGENLAWGSGGQGTPRRIVASWMRSAGHRANILGHRFREIGIGVAFAAPKSTGRRAGTFTTTFGFRR